MDVIKWYVSLKKRRISKGSNSKQRSKQRFQSSQISILFIIAITRITIPHLVSSSMIAVVYTVFLY
jgi:hypothetical protein